MIFCHVSKVHWHLSLTYVKRCWEWCMVIKDSLVGLRLLIPSWYNVHCMVIVEICLTSPLLYCWISWATVARRSGYETCHSTLTARISHTSPATMWSSIGCLSVIQPVLVHSWYRGSGTVNKCNYFRNTSIKVLGTNNLPMVQSRFSHHVYPWLPNVAFCCAEEGSTHLRADHDAALYMVLNYRSQDVMCQLSLMQWSFSVGWDLSLT